MFLWPSIRMSRVTSWPLNVNVFQSSRQWKSRTCDVTERTLQEVSVFFCLMYNLHNPFSQTGHHVPQWLSQREPQPITTASEVTGLPVAAWCRIRVGNWWPVASNKDRAAALLQQLELYYSSRPVLKLSHTLSAERLGEDHRPSSPVFWAAKHNFQETAPRKW